MFYQQYQKHLLVFLFRIILLTYQMLLINNIYGLLTKENNQSFFYSFSFSNEYKIIKNNKEISFDELKEGDNISVTYNGNVALVYPPKLESVTKIEVINK